MGASLKLTDARKRALAVLLAAESDGQDAVRVSNKTNARCIYWQSADWLAKQGLAVVFDVGAWVRFTDAGRTLAAQAVS